MEDGHKEESDQEARMKIFPTSIHRFLLTKLNLPLGKNTENLLSRNFGLPLGLRIHLLEPLKKVPSSRLQSDENRTSTQNIRTKAAEARKRNRWFYRVITQRNQHATQMCGPPNIVRLEEVVVGSNHEQGLHGIGICGARPEIFDGIAKVKSQRFTPDQTLMRQLLSGCEYIHDEFVIHRDLKPSNLLLSHSGVLKIGDFGLARQYGDPLKLSRQWVVTLYYRFACNGRLADRIWMYSTAVDIWSIGCIFGELFKLQPVFHGTNEINQLIEIFTVTGTPSEQSWPGYDKLWGVKNFEFKHFQSGQLYSKFSGYITSKSGMKLVTQLLTPCPERRINATRALQSSWFREDPLRFRLKNFRCGQLKVSRSRSAASAVKNLMEARRFLNKALPNADSSALRMHRHDRNILSTGADAEGYQGQVFL
uniref:Protein kinase domain-containing protein n=1 Tax=Ditylenchus dipsaci TaxID=166011 RepID=A0A915CQX5_9BILA